MCPKNHQDSSRKHEKKILGCVPKITVTMIVGFIFAQKCSKIKNISQTYKKYRILEKIQKNEII